MSRIVILERAILSILIPLGINFQWNSNGQCGSSAGMCFVDKRLIILKRTASFDTFAHEIAHIVQYEREGSTSCLKYPQSGRHWMIQREWIERLRVVGIDKIFEEVSYM